MQRWWLALTMGAIVAVALPASGGAHGEKWLDVFGDKIAIKARGDGRLNVSVIEEVTKPGMGPSLHVHAGTDEVFYVVEGAIRIWRGEEVIDAGPGAVALMPKGLPHTFQSLGPKPSRIVVTIMPEGFERFFEEVDARGLRMPRDKAEVDKLAAEFGLTILGPPPGAQKQTPAP
jgi:mannose-6-phosphate isomerase-like protein (cupin superfamily)